MNKPQGVVKVRNALQTSCYLLKTTPPCVYKARVCQFFLGDTEQTAVCCASSPSTAAPDVWLSRRLSTVCTFFIERLFGFNNSTLARSEFHQASRQLSVLIKSSLNMQNIRHAFYKEVSSGRSHYPSLISLIKSIPVTKEETQIKEKKLSLRKRLLSFEISQIV